MPRYQDRQQEDGPHSHDSMLGDAVPVDGADDQAIRRTYMRELTQARQAAERRLGHPPIMATGLERQTQVAARVAEVREALERINTDHQTWLHNRGGQM